MRRIVAVFCFLSLLVACQPKPVAPAPTFTALVTATRRANSLGTQTATPSPTATPLVLSGEAPSLQANAYVLKPWNGDDAWDLVAIEDPVLPEREGRQNSWEVWAKVEWTANSCHNPLDLMA